MRVVNAQGTCRALGSGTLVGAVQGQGVIITCAHLFREGAGKVTVAFGNQRTYQARLLKADTSVDLAALTIQDPGVVPVSIAEQSPKPGEPLVSCGYGSDGQLFCNRGQALGYVTMNGANGAETLELSGAARFGDSGGPILDHQGHLVAVLFGTNGRVVDGTYCGRVRQFLAGVFPGLASRPPAADPSAATPPPSAPPVTIVPPPSASSMPTEQLNKIERAMANIYKAWQALNTKVDGLVAAAEQASQAAAAGQGGEPSPSQSAPINLPADLDAIGRDADSLATAAKPWLSARLTALLVSFGIPGGIAGVAAGTVVYFVMRRGRAAISAELERIKGGAAALPTAPPTSPPQPAVVERHHTQYVAYEATALDKAWAAAHAHVGEKYPGAVPYLKMVEGVKDQLLSGNKGSSDPQVS
ncbi:MAG TPA: serine protease [Pirellulales bacterium]|nr:serine protease [Pirellulales bacterium]